MSISDVHLHTGDALGQYEAFWPGISATCWTPELDPFAFSCQDNGRCLANAIPFAVTTQEWLWRCLVTMLSGLGDRKAAFVVTVLMAIIIVGALSLECPGRRMLTEVMLTSRKCGR